MAYPGKSITYNAAGGVVIDAAGTQILLLIRPSRDEVRLPKGHIDAGETPQTAALREVTEETGYDDLEILAPLGEQLVAFPLEGQLVRRTEHYFLIRAKSKRQIERPAQDEQQFFALWVPMDEALDHITFEAEREWVRRALRILGNTQ